MKQICFNPGNYKNTIEPHDDEYFNIENQLNYLIQFKNNELSDSSLNKIIKQEIRKKMSSYKSQDKKNGKYDEVQHISYEQLLKSMIRCRVLLPVIARWLELRGRRRKCSHDSLAESPCRGRLPRDRPKSDG